MTDWTSGYMADIGYTYGYYTELNPQRVRLAFINSGLVCPEFGAACELGFGQGVSINLHAAASVTQWSGTDFNPAQAGFAQELAQASGAQTRLYDEAFAEFSNRADLPDFDYIGLHGIWSWISDENRAVIVDFIRRKLKVGGVLYISYNTQPGWSSFAPMRHLMAEHAEVLGADGCGIVSKIDGAIDFAGKLMATNPIYSRANPQVLERINKLKGQSRQYLAHEYFNRDWHPMHFSSMAEWLSPAKLQYACSAHYLDHVDVINLTTEQQDFLGKIPDPMFRQSVRDFMVNQQFRKDYWVKGARQLTMLEQAELLRAQKVILISHRSEVSLKVSGALGEANMSEVIYGPILEILADHKPRTLAQLEQALVGSSISFAQLLQAVLILIGVGHLHSVQVDQLVQRAKKYTDKLNLHLIHKTRGGGDASYLASPLTGGGIGVGRFQQIFLIAISQGKRQPAEWAQLVWQTLQAQGQRILKDGNVLEGEADHLTELTAQAQEFAEKKLPILRALQIA